MNDKHGVEILENDIGVLDCPTFSTKKIIFRATMHEDELCMLDIKFEEVKWLRGFFVPLCTFSPDELEICRDFK